MAQNTPKAAPATPARTADARSATEMPKVSAPVAPELAPSPVPPAAASPASATVSSTVATAPAAPVPSPEPVSTGPLPDPESFARTRAARELLQSIASAPSLEERLKWISDGPAYRDRVENFFKSQSPGLVVTMVEANVGAYTELPSSDEVKLLLATTASCPSGAMIRLRPQGDHRVLDWPLFEQTHQLEFDEFAANASVAPRRFQVICARSRAYDLPESQKDKHLALRAQGSLSVHGEALLYYDKHSAVGKFLDSSIVWGRGYLLDVMIEHAVVADKNVLLITDCAGADPPAK